MTREEQTLFTERNKQIEEASVEYSMSTCPRAICGDAFSELVYKRNINPTFIAGAVWADNHPKNLWKDAEGDDLPELEREVIVFTQNFTEDAGMLRVCIAHRPNPDGWDGKSLSTGKVEHYTPKTYDKGGWNIPDVKYWLDLDLPEEL